MVSVAPVAEKSRGFSGVPESVILFPLLFIFIGIPLILLKMKLSLVILKSLPTTPSK